MIMACGYLALLRDVKFSVSEPFLIRAIGHPIPVSFHALGETRVRALRFNGHTMHEHSTRGTLIAVGHLIALGPAHYATFSNVIV